MKREFTHHENSFTVEFARGVARIKSVDPLFDYMTVDTYTRTGKLIDWIQDQHMAVYGQAIAISRHSFMMEIWGHLYFEFFLLRREKLARILFPFGLYQKLVKACAYIDCGEARFDGNRWIWDILAFAAPLTGWLIPKIVPTK